VVVVGKAYGCCFIVVVSFVSAYGANKKAYVVVWSKITPHKKKIGFVDNNDKHKQFMF
jgi:hypothetical protein